MRTTFFIAAAFLSLNTLLAQDSREETVRRYLNVGRQLIENGKYDSASVVLKSAFIKNAVLPDELLYFYGLALYKKGDLDQSKKLVDKFLNISHPKSELVAEAINLQKSIETSIDAVSIMCSHCKGEGFHFHECDNCHGKGEQQCDVCKGKGKVLIGNASGMKYGLCTSCMGDGLRTCLKCGGKKQLSEMCAVCKGKGKVRSN